ncbi:hypothetical protein HOK40_02275 [Candidatus Peregrinibacteria bacterium]|jgi:hypothetical protein|nr:hypothetical protein [Candidatus Peregrinibacteria bacterium]
MNTHIPTETPILEWKAPQHLHHERSRGWYILAILFVAACFAYSVYTSAWSFTGILFLVTILYWQVHEEAPQEKTIRIWESGYGFNDSFIPWTSCDGYWILKGHGYYELHIEKKNGYETKIQIGEFDPYDIHDTLSSLLPELNDRKERVLDTIIRICKL